MTLPYAAYARLLALRTGLRRFEAWSAKQARAAGLTPAQHQLLLAIHGHGDPEGPTVGEVADYLLLRHHSAVELVDRAEAAGLVSRSCSQDDRRVVRLHLTEDGAARLEALSALHLEELDRLALDLPRAWAGLDPVYRAHGFAGPPDVADGAGGAAAGAAGAAAGAAGADAAAGAGGAGGAGAFRDAGVDVAIGRVYDPPDSGAHRVLVDRLWPRGIARQSAPFEEWLKDVAPSPALRKWYGHDPARFSEFSLRYRGELAREPGRQALVSLREQASAENKNKKKLMLLTATKDLDRSGAAVLRDVLAGS